MQSAQLSKDRLHDHVESFLLMHDGCTLCIAIVICKAVQVIYLSFSLFWLLIYSVCFIRVFQYDFIVNSGMKSCLS